MKKLATLLNLSQKTRYIRGSIPRSPNYSLLYHKKWIVYTTFFLTYMGAAFQVGKLLGVGLLVIFVIVLVALPWGIRRYNWFNLQDIIRIE